MQADPPAIENYSQIFAVMARKQPIIWLIYGVKILKIDFWFSGKNYE